MLTLLLYVLIVGLVAALLFLVVSALFGRSEELGPLPENTTATVLPAEGISGADVRALRFQQVIRGYKAGEVDWALTRLAARIDELETQLAHARSGAHLAGIAVSPNGAPIPAEPPAPRRLAPDALSGAAAPVPEVLPAADPAPLPGDHGVSAQPAVPSPAAEPGTPGSTEPGAR